METVSPTDLLLGQRVEHRPPGRQCRECRHLGELVGVTERGARRLRRTCALGVRPHTDRDWPACERLLG